MTVRPFRADHVGSLLRPKRLKEARFKFNNHVLKMKKSNVLLKNKLRLVYIALQMENFVEVGGTLIF